MTPAVSTPLRAVSTPAPRPPSHHILMTLDAVGGVWRYSMDLAGSLRPMGYRFTFVGLGPPPSPAQRIEAERIGDLVWLDAPLDWLVQDERKLDAIPPLIANLVAEREVDLVHLNLPSQATGLVLQVPLLVVSHSCVVTWFAAVRGSDVPPDWAWQKRRNRAGLENADIVVAPSRSHANMLTASYGPTANQRIVYNCSRPTPGTPSKEPMVLAAARWWDDGKNAATLDAAAPLMDWDLVLAGPNKGPAGQHISITQADHRGELPHAEVRALMSRAGIVVSPSIYEPFGLVPLEAAYAGAALVLSDIPTYRELWDGAALFACSHDAGAFAAAVNDLSRDPVLWAEMAEKAGRRAQNYTLAAQADAMDRVYAELLDNSHTDRREDIA